MTPEDRKELEMLDQAAGIDDSGSYLYGAAETLANAIPFGFGDEAGAAINAATGMANEGESYGDAYSRLLGETKARTDAFDVENPVSSLLLKVGPAIGMGVASAPKLLGAAPSLLRTTGAGVGEAALYGAGEGDENDRLNAALESAPFGLIAPIAQGAGAGYRALKGTKAKTADQIIGDALDSSGLTRTQAADKLVDGATLADISPQNKFLGQGVANVNANTRASAQVLDERAGGMTDRVLTAIKKASPGNKRLSQSRREVVSSQAKKASPWYQKAYEGDVPVSPELKSILETPAGKDAFKNAQRIAGNDKRVLDDVYTLTDDGKIIVNKIPDMQAWDDIKRGFDDVVQRETNDFGKVTPEGRRALLLKNEMLDIIDEANPAYKKARSIWAGDQSIVNAMENGRRALNKSVDDVIDMTENISKSERDAMLKGTVADIVEKIGRRGDNTVGGFSFLNNQNARTKLIAILGDDPKATKIADGIIDQIATERNFAQTRVDVLGGSQTEIRKQATEAIDGATSGMGDITSVTGAAREGFKQLRKLKGLSTIDKEDLAKKLFDPNMDKFKLEAMLKDYDVSKEVKQRLRSISLGASTGATEYNSAIESRNRP